MRSFFCLELEGAAKERLRGVSRALRASTARVRWVRPELWHVTLKFLGEVEPERVVELAELAGEAVGSVAPFELTLDTVGAFPRPQRARVLWVGSRRAPERLTRLQARLDRALSELGFEPERAYVPHVTLGRVREWDPHALRELGRQLERLKVPPIPVPVREVTLMESVLRPQGPRYQTLLRVPLPHA